MTNQVFNISKGRAVKLVQDNATKLEIVLLTVAQADDALVDHDELAAVLNEIDDEDLELVLKQLHVMNKEDNDGGGL